MAHGGGGPCFEEHMGLIQTWLGHLAVLVGLLGFLHGVAGRGGWVGGTGLVPTGPAGAGAKKAGPAPPCGEQIASLESPPVGYHPVYLTIDIPLIPLLITTLKVTRNSSNKLTLCESNVQQRRGEAPISLPLS